MNTATLPQTDLIKRLQGERVITEDVNLLLEGARYLWAQQEFTKVRASALIDTLLALPKVKDAPQAEAPEGMHRLGTEIYKVQLAVHGSGRPYAKRLVVHDSGCGLCGGDHDCHHSARADRYSVSFEVAPGMVRKLSEATKMSLEEAKEFGALYGTCCVCGRTLTDEDSIAAGIGPICSSKF